MAQQLLQDRTPAAYAGVESYARKHAKEDAGALAWLVVGYAHTLDHDYAKAIDPLNRSKSGASELGDYVAYYLGDAYLETGHTAEALSALACDDAAIGKTLQLADSRPLTTNQLFNAIATSIDGSRSHMTIPPAWVQFLLMRSQSPKITGLPHHGVPYFFVKQTYDVTQAQALLEPHHIQCPPFTSYVDKIVDYAARHPVLAVTPNYRTEER